jgi:hypothetical protein
VQLDPGFCYRQEYCKGEAEDKAAVITIGEERIQVPLGYFDKGILMSVITRRIVGLSAL